jgi:DNA-directed RNA polymerase subunit RPC12/RpoP
MITDSERIETARLLRSFSCGGSSCVKCSEISETLFGRKGAICDFDVSFEKIADLLDIPTCVMTNVGGDFENSFQCSNCMNEFDMPDYDRYPYKRCPECGAVVIPFQYE